MELPERQSTLPPFRAQHMKLVIKLINLFVAQVPAGGQGGHNDITVTMLRIHVGFDMGIVSSRRRNQSAIA